MKIAHLSSVHPAGDPRITVKECGALASAGHDVVLVCPHPNDDVVNGIRIHAISKRRGRLSRFLMGTWDVWRSAIREKADVYHLHDPELLFVGGVLRLGGAVVIYDVHEDLPRQILAKPWIPAPLRRSVSSLATFLESLLARAVSGVVAATPQIGARFKSRRMVVVQNFAIADELAVPDALPHDKRPATFAYIGGIAAIRGVYEMIDAVRRLPPELDARLTLAGLLSHDRLRRELASSPGWGLVDYVGWQTRAEIAKHLHRARAGLLLLHPTANYLESYPVKAFEYMTAGLPLIVSDFPLWRELFESVGCAIFVNPRDPAEIAAAMEWVLRNPSAAEQMGAKGRVAVRVRFNWQAEAAKLLKFYDMLVLDSNMRMVGAQLGDA
jgi:glycosyltransferase involved in cell wall biosynthesis